MFLKRIELEGFKSFADRTVVPVEGGLTGIVGPNGCGKSNVVDALLWVLGERSAKALRADAMEDVIFKGAEGRQGAPYAMVEVILGDPDGKVVEPGGEVAVGRRLFATGESEFLLHGRKVRRKDVREVLLDTGLGVRGYMVLAQGKIDAVLAANPAERRSVFEEAAGISRFKARKHETKLKLKRVEQDLARVDDVLQEVSRAVRSLKIQAGKAQRFLEVRDRYRELRVRLACADLKDGGAEARQLQERSRALESQVEDLRGSRQEALARLAELEREEGVLRERHEGLVAESSEVKEKAAGLEERVHGLEARAHEAEQRATRDRGRLQELEGEAVEEGAQEQELVAEEARLAHELEQAAAALAAAEEAFNVARDSRQDLRGRMEELRREVLGALQERTQWNNRVAEAARQRSEAEGGLRALARRREEREGEIEASASELAAATVARDEAIATDEREQAGLQAIEAEVADLRDRRTGFAVAAHEARQHQAAHEARRDALQVVDEEMPGVPPHLRRLMGEAPEGQLQWMLDRISAPAPWDRHLEGLLGRLQHALWAEDPAAVAAGQDGVVDLFFAAPDLDGGQPVVEGAPSLLSLLEGDAAVLAALGRRLGPVGCVETAAEARELAARHPQGLYLSADGELHGHGYRRAGSRPEDGSGLLVRRNELAACEQALAQAAIEFERAHALETEVADALATAEAQLAEQTEVARAAAHAREEVERRRADLERRDMAFQQEAAAMREEEAQLGRLQEEAAQAEAEAVAKRDQVEAGRSQANDQLEGLQGELPARDATVDEASGLLQEARVSHQRLEQESKHWHERHAALVARRDRQQRESGKLSAEIDTLAAQAVQLRAEAETAREERTSLLARRSELGERVTEAGAQRARASEALQSARARQQGEEGQLEGMMEERQALALEVQRVQMQLEEMRRSLQAEFSQPLEELARSLEVDPREPLDAEADEPALREELATLRRRLDGIGAVNLDAVQELEERQERETFLVRERDDLREAQANLLASLEELDQVCRSRFQETFDLVQSQFEQIFRRLFRGGRASIALEEGADPLEAGIDINVRPPGKELRSINLLSGGERTLTALALLLAVFQSRPSPFCLLDEVDAALDDANVERFVDVLGDFTGSTQFLVVTHNRITMARCERLFGVTMRKRGVSMVVSVELAQLAQEGELDLSSAEAVDPARAGRGSAPDPARGAVEATPEMGMEA
jgi:chromosome segregation protein